MNKITSTVIGDLIQNEQFTGWWYSKPTLIPLLDLELPITFIDYDPLIDTEFIPEADAALKNFLAFTSIEKLKLAPHIFENFVEISSYLNVDDIPEKIRGAQPLSIWNFVHPTQLFINRRPTNDKDLYVVLACECEWEKEHGLQMVFRQGKKLTRVSDQDGHLTEADAYDLPDDKDELLSKF